MLMSKKTPLSLFIRQAQLYPLDSPFLPPINKVEDGYKYANNTLEGTLEAGAAGLPKTGQTTSYRTGDDGDLQKGLPETGDRFTDNGDNTITDNVTGLMYPDAITSLPEPFTTGGGGANTLSWNDAIDAAIDLSFAGYDDWRLINIFEAIVLYCMENNSPIWWTTYFDLPASGYFWTSTTPKRTPTKALALNNYFDPIIVSDIKTNLRHAFPVRSV